MKTTRDWAEEEFGETKLGDVRRTRRLVQLAREIASRPSGKVTRACETSAAREGAFRLLENKDVHPEPIVRAVTQATLARSAGQTLVYVAVDATSLNITDTKKNKGTGAVGAWSLGARGVHVMTSFAVAEDGSPIGICGQDIWARSKRAPNDQTRSYYGRAIEERETQFWLDQLAETHANFVEHLPQCVPFYQLDRGADCWPVFKLANELGLLLTVRAAHNRCVKQGTGLLWPTAQKSRVVGRCKVPVPARPATKKNRRINKKRVWFNIPPRPARIATVTLRITTVTLEMTGVGRRIPVKMNVVLAREESGPDLPRQKVERLEWMLLTTHPVRSRKDALAVIYGYTRRWRVEEFHKMWKSGLCNVEDTQLRSLQAIRKWATLLASVASRAMRLTHLARSDPDASASEHFTKTELEAIIALRQPKGIKLDFVPSLAQAVRWIADIGGYIGPWNGPPGQIVIGRGLHDVLVAANAFEHRKNCDE